ncbi:MAG: Maf family protein [Clostridia bacterium]
MSDINLILASASPRRRELMALAGYAFDVIVSSADENIPKAAPSEYVERIALRKADAVFSAHPAECVVGADTVVVIDDTIIGKPKDEYDAFRILSTLSGRTHTVYTGVAVLSPCGKTIFHDATRVTFCRMSEDEIRSYIRSGEPMDKAGAYGIQGPGAVFVESIVGNYFTIIGMPLPKLYRALGEVGIYPNITVK